MRAILHYLTTMIIIPFYGIQVCPFIEGLSPWQIAVPVVIFLTIQFLLRFPIRNYLMDVKDIKVHTLYAFWIELLLFFLTASGLTIYNSILYKFPIGSGLKLMVGIVGLGFLAATDLALEEERRVTSTIETGDAVLKIDANYFPLTRKVALFASITSIILIAVFILLVNKDLGWLVSVEGSVTLAEARLSVIKEFVFVLVVILSHILNIIHSHAKNLGRVLNNENNVLKQVAAGNYNQLVPVSTYDEFGVMAEHTNIMVERIKERTIELSRTRDVTILSLATLAETRDNETGAHLLRTQRYVRALATYLSKYQKFAEILTEENIDLLYKSAPLHDIGKVGIPDAILLKPGKLTDDEFKIMKTHAKIGSDAIKVAERELGENSFLRFAREIAISHHEKWDGSGYPRRLAGDNIPVSGRLMAVADVYDALISKRIYKPAFSHEKAMNIMREENGKHFDPDMVDALNACEHEFIEICKQFRDEYTE